VRVEVENFKSVGRLELELAPVTILVGPPGAGKSNILDAIELAGYFGRLASGAYPYGNYEPLAYLIRATGGRRVLTYGSSSKRATVALSPARVAVEVDYSSGKPAVAVNGEPLGALGDASVGKARGPIRAMGNLPEARLYGYDRFGLSSPTCGKLACNFALRAQGRLKVPEPRGVLSELGWNAAALREAMHGVAEDVNALVASAAGLELKALQSGAVALFDRGHEVSYQAAPDSIYRTLYYLLAVKTSADYAQRYGKGRNYVAILEDPKVPPLAYPLLAEYLGEASEHIYIVVEAGGPLLVSTLLAEVKGAKAYYVGRSGAGLTQVQELEADSPIVEGAAAGL